MLVGALCGLIFLVAGGLAYAGRGRSIVLKGFPRPCCSSAWPGSAPGAWSSPSRASCRRPGTLSSERCSRSQGVVAVLVFLLSFAWMPRRLQPRWYRDWCDRGRNHAEYPPLAVRAQRRRERPVTGQVEHVVDGTSGVGLAVPPGWHRSEQSGAVLVLTPREWPPDFGFRPNLTVVVEPAGAGTTVGEGRPMALATVLGTLADAHVAAYDVWPTRDPRVITARVAFAYLADGITVLVNQWVFTTEQGVVTVTGSADTDRFLRCEPLFTYALQGLSLPGMDAA